MLFHYRDWDMFSVQVEQFLAQEQQLLSPLLELAMPTESLDFEVHHPCQCAEAQVQQQSS